MAKSCAKQGQRCESFPCRRSISPSSAIFFHPVTKAWSQRARTKRIVDSLQCLLLMHATNELSEHKKERETGSYRQFKPATVCCLGDKPSVLLLQAHWAHALDCSSTKAARCPIQRRLVFVSIQMVRGDAQLCSRFSLARPTGRLTKLTTERLWWCPLISHIVRLFPRARARKTRSAARV